ncbi:uncharacterized protein LOC121386835 [Gigantopelta aegis]|uniref:uncharacterized protein LOC121386835 n=1 Tax=Gigantopelta aegis TaxID=1735272 RepID=UPI001B88BCBF|nr:uncharacterized protein LOC121386835 [Gigantopelta aegis]
MDSKIYTNDAVSPCNRCQRKMTLVRNFPFGHDIPNEPQGNKITDVVVLDDDVILVADSSTRVIKAFSLHGDYISSSERFDAEGMFGPDIADENVEEFFGLMTAIDKSNFAVAVPGAKGFAILMLTPEKMFVVRKAVRNTFHRYWGVHRYHGNRYLCSTDRLFDVMTTDLEPIGRLTSEFDFRKLSCIAVSENGNVVVADQEKQCIVVVGKTGYLLRQVHLGIPGLRGIALDGDNIFYLSSENTDLSYFSLKTGTIHVVSAKSNPEKLDNPIAIRYLGNGDVIIAEEGGNIKIYHLDNYSPAVSWFKWRDIRRFCWKSLPWRQITEVIGFQGMMELLLLPVSNNGKCQ